MNKKILKAIKIAVIIYMIATLVSSLMISQNNHHLEICHQEHCMICTIIHFTQTMISLSIALVISVMIDVLIYLFLSRLHKEEIIFVPSSLVSLKIQFNE